MSNEESRVSARFFIRHSTFDIRHSIPRSRSPYVVAFNDYPTMPRLLDVHRPPAAVSKRVPGHAHVVHPSAAAVVAVVEPIPRAADGVVRDRDVREGRRERVLLVRGADAARRLAVAEEAAVVRR